MNAMYQETDKTATGNSGNSLLTVEVLSRLLKPRFDGTWIKTHKMIGSKNEMFQSFNEMMSEDIEIKELIGGLISGGCTCQLFGPSGDGKTFVALDLGLSVASGKNWNGLPCKQGLVIYFNGEGRHGFKLRCRAWQKMHSVYGNMFFYSAKTAVSFDAAGIEEATSEIKLIEQQTSQNVSLIIVDTLARHLIGDENSTKDMSEFVRAVDDMRDTFTDSTALIVHHTGNNAEVTGRSRGSSALKAALDIEIQCMKGTLTFTKCKDIEAPAPIEFKLKVLEVGTKPDGTSITSCVPVYGEKSTKNSSNATVKMSGAEKHIFKMITSEPEKEIVFYRDEYCKRMSGLCPDNKPDTARRNFERAVKSLIEKEKLFIYGDVISLDNSDKSGQMPKLSGNLSGRTRTTTLKSCPVVRDLSESVLPEPELVFGMIQKYYPDVLTHSQNISAF